MKRIILPAVLSLLLGASADAQQHQMHKSPYANETDRKISSLSADDIEQLKAGAGWGLAKPAELNGFPGPAHVLDLAAELSLNVAQRAQVEAIRAEMKASATAKGETYLATEKMLDHAFQLRTVTEDKLRLLLAAAEEARSDLRYTHLVAHLRVAELLKPRQIAEYARLRGYAAE